MRTDVTTPQGIFGMPQHLTVPIYQRPYVWSEDEQWGPLWADIRRITEHNLSGAQPPATHFLGAVVTQQAEQAPVGVQEFLIVDGQQRLTTLQLIVDATAAALSARGFDELSGRLEFLTHNSAVFGGVDDDRLKLRHTNRDRAAFDEVMLAPAPVEHSTLRHRDTRIVKAHAYFTNRVNAWLDEETGTPAETRATALATALQSALQLVVIQLTADEDSQEIFETLNARGTPLTAADLIKNFVFQRLKAEGVDEGRIYAESWPFESKFWEQEISVGRLTTTRSAVFLGQWLVSRVGKEVSPRSTFARFKFFVEHEANESMVTLLARIAEQAASYQRITEHAADPRGNLDRLALHVYRVGVAQVEITKPILIWLTEPDSPYSMATVERVIGSVESWVMRRRLLKLQSSDLGRIAAELISFARGSDDSDLAAAVDRFLASQQVASTYWPGDAEVRANLAAAAFYRRYSAPMQRVFLQAIEDGYRGFAGGRPSAEIRVHRDRQQIEHLLPRSWRSHWPVDDAAAEADREEHVHRLGNLTLITGALNASVSNGPWLGEQGKWVALDRHDLFIMNREVRRAATDGWDEARIDRRTAEMIDLLLATWPVPAGHQGAIIDRQSRIAKSSVTYADLVAVGLLRIGDALVLEDHRWGDIRCEVLAGGKVLYEGLIYNTPSQLSDKIRGGAGNAWLLWRVDGGPLLNALRERYASGEQSTETIEPAPDDAITPATLARELGVDAKQVRAVLREHYGLLDDSNEARWVLSEAQADEIRKRITR